jgi:hypothetical protein
MKRIAWLSCGAVLCVAVTVGLAQQPAAEADAFIADEAAAPTNEAAEEPIVEAARALNAEDLRGSYMVSL